MNFFEILSQNSKKKNQKMGVKGLMSLIDENAKGSFKLTEQKNVR